MNGLSWFGASSQLFTAYCVYISHTFNVLQHLNIFVDSGLIEFNSFRHSRFMSMPMLTGYGSLDSILGLGPWLYFQFRCCC